MALSASPVYLLSGICVAVGLNCVVSPKGEYHRFGLPLERPPPTPASDKKGTTSASSHATGTVSPLMFVKGTREICFGLNFAALQYQGFYAAVTTCLAVYSLAALVDGFVIWSAKDNRSRRTAFGHWAFGIGFAVWAAWRNSAA